jgi:hypothetical protein
VLRGVPPDGDGQMIGEKRDGQRRAPASRPDDADVLKTHGAKWSGNGMTKLQNPAQRRN